MKILSRSKYLPFLISFVFLLVFILIIKQYAEFDSEKEKENTRGNLLELLNSKKSQLEKSLYSRIYYTKGIAAYASVNPDITRQEFDDLAGELIQGDSVISSMSLAKDCIIGAIYPYKGHETAIGLDLLEHPKRREIVKSTIETRNTFIAGPVELIEGGIAFISYTPIFLRGGDNSKFWGVTDIVIHKDKLLNEIGLNPRDTNYIFALKGHDGLGLNGDCFWGDATIFVKDPVLTEINLPTGTWVMAGVPKSGWQNPARKSEVIIFILYISAAIISLLIWQLAKAVLKIRLNERELKAMFGGMNDLVIQFNERGIYTKIAPTNENLLVEPAEKLVGKSLYDIFEKEKADYFMEAIRKCLTTKEMVVLDYPLEIESRPLWFQARITYLSSDSVIFVAHDNTAQKMAQKHLNESRQKLIELNASKDKFFSIIAHDLKGPFMGFLGISEELSRNISELTHEEIVELANVLHSSAKNTFSLLNNLLEWSRLQTGSMQLHPESIKLKTETEECISLFNSAASMKSIEIVNKIQQDICVLADRNMFNTVLRNLLSNAIKFTPPNGKIVVNSILESGKAKLIVCDTGVGMGTEVMEKIFRIDTNYSTKGTLGEEGTGLGLILCKELVEKNGGEIEINSIKDSGTSISITIPLTK